jgi:hypothetical protein
MNPKPDLQEPNITYRSDRLVDVRLDLVDSVRPDELEPAPPLDLLRSDDQFLFKVRRNRFVHQNTFRRHADLSGVEDTSEQDLKGLSCVSGVCTSMLG